ncbi:unnamed protein product [Ambrosiozyma monospora]|uniref:Unnamed protein product n=1 Tax=Ambrosiozyma monospora TaxID=43982 RepID=A0A9W6Z7L3_AMBMO|nr:unnamed protein product [Ambrosiozyma monospora]
MFPKSTRIFKKANVSILNEMTPSPDIHAVSGRGKRKTSVRHDIDDQRMDVVCCYAGFNENENYYCKRNIEPPQSLQDQLFPWVDGYLYRHDINVKGDAKRNVLTFLEVLRFLKRTLLQDLPFIFKEYPNHVLTKMKPFCTQEFKTFSQKVLATIRQPPEPISSQLPTARELNSAKGTLFEGLMHQMNMLTESVQDLQRVVTQRHDARICVITVPLFRTGHQIKLRHLVNEEYKEILSYTY